MESLFAHLSDVKSQINDFLKAYAREQHNDSAPLILKFAYEGKLTVKGKSSDEWKVEENYLSNFEHIYTNPAFKLVRLVEWRVQLKFKGKVCTKMDVISPDAEFYSAKESKRITACHFQFTVAQTPQQFSQLEQQTNGYLNRIGKRELCSVSLNIHKEMRSLIRFAVPKEKPIPPKLDYRPWKHSEQEVNPLSALTPAGLAVLEKMRHFVKIDQLIDFTVTHDLSGQCTKNLQQLIQKAIKKQRKL